MPRGGRRPGAGAPRGNLNALNGGARSRRLGAVLAALLSEPEIRQIILGLLLGGEEAHREFRELVVTSARVLYERPVNEELRELANRAAAAHIERLGAVGIHDAVLRYRGQLGFEDLLPAADPAPAARRDNPVFREFCRLLLDIDPAGSLRRNQSTAIPSRPSSLNLKPKKKLMPSAMQSNNQTRITTHLRNPRSLPDDPFCEFCEFCG